MRSLPVGLVAVMVDGEMTTCEICNKDLGDLVLVWLNHSIEEAQYSKPPAPFGDAVCLKI